MTDLSSKPAHSAQNRELTFEQLLDSDEAATLLRKGAKCSGEHDTKKEVFSA